MTHWGGSPHPPEDQTGSYGSKRSCRLPGPKPVGVIKVIITIWNQAQKQTGIKKRCDLFHWWFQLILSLSHSGPTEPRSKTNAGSKNPPKRHPCDFRGSATPSKLGQTPSADPSVRPANSASILSGLSFSSPILIQPAHYLYHQRHTNVKWDGG